MRRGRSIGVFVCAAAFAAGLSGCVPPAPAAVGPAEGTQTVTIAFTGAYDYSTSGPTIGASVDVSRDGDGSLAGLHGSVDVPGRGAQPATITFDLDISPVLGVATGSIDVVDPAAGLAVTTPMVATSATITGDGASGSVDAQRIWRLVETLPYRLTWSVTSGGVAPPPTPPASTATSGSLSVLTYNVAGLPEPISGSSPATNSELISPLLNAYDLTLLQEDFFYADRIARHIDHPYGSPPERLVFGGDPTRPSAIVGSGLERYARHPFDHYLQVRWPGCYGGALGAGAADCLSQKGFSVAQHHLADGVTVDVYDLHGEAGSTPEDYMWSSQDFVTLAAYINANSVGHAVIVGGDFNLDPSNEIDGPVLTTFIAAAGLTDVCDVQDCSADPTSIDRLLFRSSDDLTLTPTAWSMPGGFVDAGGDPLSDHPPVAATFAWSAG